MTLAGLFAKHCFVKAVGWFVEWLVSCAKILFRYIRYSNAIILAFYSIGLFAGPPSRNHFFKVAPSSKCDLAYSQATVILSTTWTTMKAVALALWGFLSFVEASVV